MGVARFFVLLLGLGFGLAGPGWATTPTAGIEGLGTEVADSELAEMRGKFIRPGDISFFGIEMLSSWQAQDGIITQARLIVSLDFADINSPSGIVPQLFVAWSRDGDSSLDLAGADNTLAAQVVIPVGGLDSVHGFVQHQQIAGSDNHVRNDMAVALVPGQSNGLDTSGMTPLTSPSSVQFADGDTLQFQLGGNRVGMTLTDGNNAVRQTVSGDLNQLAQHVLVNSDFNDITNNMNAIVGFDASAQATRLNAQNAINGLNGLGF